MRKILFSALLFCAITTASTSSIEVLNLEIKVESPEFKKKKTPEFCALVAADVLDLIDPYNDMPPVTAHNFYQTAFNICMGS